jgi:hypothetical protein
VLVEEHRKRQRTLEAARAPRVPTFSEFSKEWLQKLRVQAAKGEKKLSSIEAIESCLRIHVLPFIGDKRLDQIEDDVIDALEAKWVRGGYEYVGPWGRTVSVNPLASAATRNNRLLIPCSRATFNQTGSPFRAKPVLTCGRPAKRSTIAAK